MMQAYDGVGVIWYCVGARIKAVMKVEMVEDDGDSGDATEEPDRQLRDGGFLGGPLTGQGTEMSRGGWGVM